jgi:hypothetical protein
MMTFTSRPLYGGAIICELPTDWEDLSDIRQVPDHQEAFIGTDSEEPLFAIEIMEYQGSISNDQAAKHYFDDLAKANGSSMNDFLPYLVTMNAFLPYLEGTSSSLEISAGIGLQQIPMGRDVDIDRNPRMNQEVRTVQIELCVVRLPQVPTDLLLTLSRTKPARDNQLSEEFRRIVSTLQIRDWGVFGS